MPRPRVWFHDVWEGADWQPLDRLVKKNLALVQAADVSTIDIRIYDRTGRDLLFSRLAIAPGDGITGPIFDTLQVDGRWAPGPPGYNSLHTLTRANFQAFATPFEPEPGHHYRCEIVTNTSSDGRIVSVHDYHVHAVYSNP